MRAPAITTHPINLFGQYKQIEGILDRIRSVSVAVFGDFCVDAYWALQQGEPEISIETGLPVMRVSSQRYSLGGAGNVVANLRAMGARVVRPVGISGGDLFGLKLRAMLTECGADLGGMLVDDGWETMVYAKPYAGDREQSRIDFGAFNELSKKMRDALLDKFVEAVKSSDAVILNQQVPGGISSPEVISRVNEVIRNHPEKLFLADARCHPEQYAGAVLKLNMREAAQFLGESVDGIVTEDCAKSFALRIQRQISRPAFLTRGELGIVVADDDDVTSIPGLQIPGATDSVGAGDTVVAALAASLAAGAAPVEAAVFANIAAMVTVRKVRTTGTASDQDILAVASEPSYVFRPELAESNRGASYLPGTEIEVVTSLPDDLDIRHCIFDHDGTISTLREGWEQIMVPMMVRAILGGSYDTIDQTADQVVFRRITAMVREYIDSTTGIQTLVQMEGLADLVRQGGYVPASEVLDGHGYKRVFNDALLAMVAKRIEKLRRGELQPADFEVKNVVTLLERLYRRGVKLYLASGTDQADVVAEAEALGYAPLFEGRIFGAVGNIKIEAKKMILEKIIGKHNLSGRQFATFGDGAMEMREGRLRGGLCIGVASDELRRFGLNLSKRKRLIRAGADLVLPDFSQSNALLSALRLNGE